MITNGLRTIKHPPWRVQLYWPNFTARKGKQTEFMVGMDTVVRFVIDRRNGFYWGIGLMLFGVGIGFDYFSPDEEAKKILAASTSGTAK